MSHRCNPYRLDWQPPKQPTSVRCEDCGRSWEWVYRNGMYRWWCVNWGSVAA